MKRHGRTETILTNRLRSYGAAMKDLGQGYGREMGRWLNKSAENSNLSFRRLERAMLQLRHMRTLRNFTAVHALDQNHFPTDRDDQDRKANT
jgi:putative transposase